MRSSAPQVLEGTWEEVTQHAAEPRGKRVRLLVLEGDRPDDAPFQERATPDQWIDAFQAWSNSHRPRNAPPIPDEALGRDSIYEEP